MSSKYKLSLGFLVLFSATSFLFAEDWAGFRGSDRSGHSKESKLLATWPKDGPKQAWLFKDCGTGYSSPAIVQNNIYIMGARKGEELLLKIDSTGKELWNATIGPVFDFKGNKWSGGPNGSPTVDDNLVFALGSQGTLICSDAKTGQIVWKKDLPKDLSAEVNPIGGGPEKFGWGYSWSPIVDGDKLIIVPGGSLGLLAALNKKTGEPLWRSADVKLQAPYASPTLATIDGQKTIVQITQKGCVGVNPDDGKLLWEYKREAEYHDVVCTSPVISGNLIATSVGFGDGMDCFKIEKSGSSFQAKQVYSKKEIANDNGGIVLVGKHVYGFHMKRFWECIDIETGAVAWTSARKGLTAGSVIAADGRLYVLAEDSGEVAMLAASPAGYKEISKFKIPELSTLRKDGGKLWAHPAISDGKLFIRDQELLYCFEIR